MRRGKEIKTTGKIVEEKGPKVNKWKQEQGKTNVPPPVFGGIGNFRLSILPTVLRMYVDMYISF